MVMELPLVFRGGNRWNLGKMIQNTTDVNGDCCSSGAKIIAGVDELISLSSHWRIFS